MAIVITILFFTVPELSIMLIRLIGKPSDIRCIYHRVGSPMAACAALSLRWGCKLLLCIVGPSVKLEQNESGEHCQCSHQQQVSAEIAALQQLVWRPEQ